VGAMADLNTAAEYGAPDPSSIVPRSGAGDTGGEKSGGEPGKPSRVVTATSISIVAIPDAAVVSDGPSAELRSRDSERMGAAMALSNRGAEMTRRGDTDAAIEDYTKSIEIFPTGVAYGNRAAALLRKGDREGALADLNRAVELDPRHAPSLFQRGQLLLELGREEEARKDFARCLELNPSMKPMIDATLANRRRGESKQP
jgi:tetratricopeptide (TPR) repeat protein